MARWQIKCLFLVDATFGRYLDQHDLWGKLKSNDSLDWIYHRHLSLFPSRSHGWFKVSLSSLSITCPWYVNKADVIISWSDTETHLTRHVPPHLWHPSEVGTGNRLLDKFIQRAAQMLLIFEKPQPTQRKLKVRGIALVATWHTSFTQLPCNSIVFTEHETIW